jgi:hypothetical protein
MCLLAEARERWMQSARLKRVNVKLWRSTMKNIYVVAVALSLALFAVPAFAADETLPSFQALSEMATDAHTLTPLTDEQLASVEGGDHLTLATILINFAAVYQQPASPLFNLALANVFEGAATAALALNPSHVCGGMTSSAC